MLPESLHMPLVNILASNFTTEEIDLLGKYFEPKYNSHFISGEPFGITLRPEQAAQTMVKYFASKGKIEELIVLIVHSENNPTIIRKSISINGLAEFMQKMGGMGYVYDQTTDSIVKKAAGATDTWGLLREGEIYDFTFLSIDIAGNSIIQTKYPKSDIESVYAELYSMIENTVTFYNGKIWTWAGDGGIAAFYLKNTNEDAIHAAIRIQTAMTAFNLFIHKNKFVEPIRLRIAGHHGLTAYKENKGAILSEAINYVAHLEKKGTDSDGISISRDVYEKLNERLRKVFLYRERFEDRDTYSVSFNYPWLNF